MTGIYADTSNIVTATTIDAADIKTPIDQLDTALDEYARGVRYFDRLGVSPADTSVEPGIIDLYGGDSGDLGGHLNFYGAPTYVDSWRIQQIGNDLDMKRNDADASVSAVNIKNDGGGGVVDLNLDGSMYVALNFVHEGASSQIAFFGATPASKTGATNDLKDTLVSYGLVTDGGATPLDLDSGALTAGAISGTTGAFSSNATVGGTFGVTGNTTLSGTLSGAGVANVTVNDGTTNSFTAVLLLGHNTTGTPANNIGTAVEFYSETSTTVDTLTGRIRCELNNVTHASRTARMVFVLVDNGGSRNCLTLAGSGSAPEIGFYGTATAAKQTVTGSRGGNAALASLLTALAATGLLTDSSSA